MKPRIRIHFGYVTQYRGDGNMTKLVKMFEPLNEHAKAYFIGSPFYQSFSYNDGYIWIHRYDMLSFLDF